MHMPMHMHMPMLMPMHMHIHIHNACTCTCAWASPPSGPDAHVGPYSMPSPMTERSIFIVDAVPVRRKQRRTLVCALTKSCAARIGRGGLRSA